MLKQQTTTYSYIFHEWIETPVSKIDQMEMVVGSFYKTKNTDLLHPATQIKVYVKEGAKPVLTIKDVGEPSIDDGPGFVGSSFDLDLTLTPEQFKKLSRSLED